MTARRVGDFVIYIAVGLAFVFVIYWMAVHVRGSGKEVIGKWVGLAVNTAIVFGYTIRENKSSFKRRSFWGILFLLLVLHLLVFSLLLRALDEWRVIWWAFVAPIEYVLIGSAVMLARRLHLTT